MHLCIWNIHRYTCIYVFVSWLGGDMWLGSRNTALAIKYLLSKLSHLTLLQGCI